MSDLNLRSGLPAWMRLNGIWRKVTQRPITTDELLAALERLTKNNSVSALIKSGQSDYDFAHEIEESRGVRRRFRGNATPVADGYSTGVKIVFRTIPSMPPALEDLNVEQGILDHAMPSNGLVLVTGVMGSGKSTLLETPLERLILKTEDLLAASGQRIQDAAQTAYENGNIARDSYLAILAERKHRKGTDYGATA